MIKFTFVFVRMMHRFQRSIHPVVSNGAMPFRFSHHVHAVVDAIDQIHIGIAGRTKHYTGSRGLSPGGMGGRVMGAKIPLYLDNPADPHPIIRRAVYEMFSEQLQGHLLGISVIKVARKGSFRRNCIKRFHIIFVVLFPSNIGAEQSIFFAIILSINCQCLKVINRLEPRCRLWVMFIT